jgi:hypothetical protein
MKTTNLILAALRRAVTTVEAATATRRIGPDTNIVAQSASDRCQVANGLAPYADLAMAHAPSPRRGVALPGLGASGSLPFRHRFAAGSFLCGSLATAALFVCEARAAISLTDSSFTGGTFIYSQIFGTLPASGSLAWADNSTIPGWYAQQTVGADPLVADDGTNAVPGFYNYGSLTWPENRALGSLGSKDTGDFAWGVAFTNNSSTTIVVDFFSYIGEQWRKSGETVPQSMTFHYQISGAPITNLTPGSDAGWTAVPFMDFHTPVNTPGAGPLDGNIGPDNRTVLTWFNSGIHLPVGDTIMFRWRDIDHLGEDHGLAIDHVRITFIPEPSSALLGLSALGLLLRRKR